MAKLLAHFFRPCFQVYGAGEQGHRWLLACYFGLVSALAQAQPQAAPQRIVSLLPSLTETVCVLGQCQRLVGVDSHSNWPAAVAALPKLGGGLAPNIEAIVALRPDLVLLAQSARGAERLRALGLRVVAIEPKTHADARSALTQVAQLLGLPEAQGERAWRQIEGAVNTAAHSLPAHLRGTLVYFEVNSAPYGAGASSFIGETLTRLGLANIIPASLGPFPQLNPEFVVRANPELIMIGDEGFAGANGLAQRPGWRAIRALREQRLCVFSPPQADVLVRAGPRMAEAAQLMVDCVTRTAPPGLMKSDAATGPEPTATARSSRAHAPLQRHRDGRAP